MTDTLTFGIYLKQLRKQKKAGGILQKELTDALDCSDQAISDWDCGRYLPSEEKVSKLRGALKLSREELAELIQRYLNDQDRMRLKRLGAPELLERLKLRWEISPRTRMPLYRSSDTVDPLEVVTERFFWHGEYVGSFPRLGRYTFAYRMPDESMLPRYSKDDLIVCNIMVKLREHGPAPVVACIHDRVYCRLLCKRASQLVFTAANRKLKPIVVPKGQISWLYGVAMRVTRENWWDQLE